MLAAICILCKTNEFATEIYPRTFDEKDLNPKIFSARRSPDRLHESILRCSRCGLVYPRMLVDASVLTQLYKASAYNYKDQQPHIQKTYRRYVKKLLKHLHRHPHPLSYLDIGCGNGFMLEEALSLGCDAVCGVEPSSHAIEQASTVVKPFIVQGMFTPMLLKGKTFSAISCFQTLDHITDPVAFVRMCLDSLTPGGAVLFINHNIASLPAKILGERCPMIDIEHTYLHTPQTMRMLFDRVGFTDISVFRVRNDYPLSYWLHLLPLPPSLKNFCMNTMRLLHLQNIIVPFWPGNIGLIAHKPL